MEDVWDEHAADWDDQDATRAYARAAFDSLRPILEEAGIDLAGARVVDFGCGTGLLTEALVDAGAAVVAVDTSTAMLAVLDHKIEQRRWTGVATTTTLDDVAPSNDVIVCSSVCAFLDDYAGTVARLAGLLDPGGVLVQWDWEREGDDDHGLSRDEIVHALSNAGLEAVEVDVAFEIEVEGQTMRPLVGHGRRMGGAEAQ